MKEITLTKGLFAIVDDEDYPKVARFRWYAKKNHGKYYAQRNSGDHGRLQLHDFILPPPEGMTVDHINGNSLDNRRCNLRFATQQEQCFNRTKRKGTSSIYKGVSYSKPKGKWQAYICLDKKIRHLGYFLEDYEAAYAYDREALRLFGDRARCNLTPAFIMSWIDDLSETMHAMDAGARQMFGETQQASLF